jgi:hypothetical protein
MLSDVPEVNLQLLLQVLLQRKRNMYVTRLLQYENIIVIARLQ